MVQEKYRRPVESSGKRTAQEDDSGAAEDRLRQSPERASCSRRTRVGPLTRVAPALDVSERTVRRAKRRYVEEGLEEVLRRHNSPKPYRKVDDKVRSPPDSLGLQSGSRGP